ncbi:MAG: AsmA family protein [Pseudomonadota bacterium]
MITLACILGLLLFLAWLVVFSRFFAEPRGVFVGEYLSDRLGENISILGGLDVSLDPPLHLKARDVRIKQDVPGETRDLGLRDVAFTVDWRALRQEEVRLSGLTIDGAEVDIRVAADAGDDSEAPQPATNASATTLPGMNIDDILTDHRVDFTDAGVHYRNAISGVDLDLKLSTMSVAQDGRDAPWLLKGVGDLNGADVTVDGTFPKGQPFDISAETEQLSLKVTGTPDPGGFTSGFTADIAAEVNELGQLLDILKLQKPISGKGSLSGTFTSADGKNSLSDVDVRLNLDNGESLVLTGELGELHDLNDATLEVYIDLYPKDGMPAPAKLLRDLKLTGVEMHLTAQPDGVPLRRMNVRTNGFTLNTHGKGPPPITVSDIVITPDGLLNLGKVGLRIGPPGAYFLVFDGSIGDAVRFEEIALGATLDLSTLILFEPERFERNDALGNIVGTFKLAGDSKSIALSDMDVKAQGSDLVQLGLTGGIGNVLKLSDIALSATGEIPSGGKLLAALNLSSISTGDIKLDAKVASNAEEFSAQGSVAVAKSNLDISLQAKTGTSPAHLTGTVDSSLIRLEDIRHVIAMVRELGGSNRATDPGGGAFTDVTLDPLTTQLLEANADMDVQVDLKKLEGVAGPTELKTEFILDNEKARLGPVKFAYDGGHFDVTALVDLKNNPEIVKLEGRADGWNLGTLQQELDLKPRASGTLNSSFNVSGAHKSLEGFAKSADGELLLSLENGTINTRLVDLAGLGLFPWLFSDGHGKVAPIDCIRAPLFFETGKIDLKQVAMETAKVQLVLTGDVNLDKDTLDLTGEPRPIGEPLARSPWPFVVTGTLKHPKFGLKHGTHRQVRTDGARTMPADRKPCVPDILQLQ